MMLMKKNKAEKGDRRRWGREARYRDRKLLVEKRLVRSTLARRPVQLEGEKRGKSYNVRSEGSCLGWQSNPVVACSLCKVSGCGSRTRSHLRF